MSEIKVSISTTTPVISVGNTLGAVVKIVTPEPVLIKASSVGERGLQGPTGPTGPAGIGDMTKTVYDADNDGVVDIAKEVQQINGGYF